MYSIRWRIVLAYLIIICVAFAIVATMLIRMVGEYLFSQKVREEQRMTEDLAAGFVSVLGERDAWALYAQVLEAAEQSDSRVIVLDTQGVAQADSLSQANGQRLALQEVGHVLEGGASTYGFYDLRSSSSTFLSSLSFSARGDALMGVYTAPIPVEGRLAGVVLYLSDAREVFDNLTRMQLRMTVWLVMVALAVLMMSILVTRLFTRPIEELSAGIARMTNGDLSSRVNVRGHNEYSQLAEAFNMMCQRLEQLDQTRNQFVSNASHELKTPLSTIKVLIQTLQYQDVYNPEMQAEFLGDIDAEIDRLNAIVEDLLTLVNIDSRRQELRPELLRLDELLNETAHRLQPLAETRGIRMDVVVKDRIETMADARKLSQVFYNLMDNAVKYTPDGGFVRTEVGRNGRMARIVVSDSGIGIPKADQIHVFDRFYRVDKARARATGGTGLGLSIVKQFILMHEGTIRVDSEENVGSTFTVELPIINLSA